MGDLVTFYNLFLSGVLLPFWTLWTGGTILSFGLLFWLVKQIIKSVRKIY